MELSSVLAQIHCLNAELLWILLYRNRDGLFIERNEHGLSEEK